MQIELTENLETLYQVKTWLTSANQCRAWAGDVVRFPFFGTSIEDDIEFSKHQHLVTYIDDKLAAFAQLQSVHARHLHTSRIIVNPRMRGQGIAPKFVKLLTEQAQLLHPQVTTITLNVIESNLTALKIYAHHGFEQFGFIEPDIIQMRFRI